MSFNLFDSHIFVKSNIKVIIINKVLIKKEVILIYLFKPRDEFQ